MWDQVVIAMMVGPRNRLNEAVEAKFPDVSCMTSRFLSTTTRWFKKGTFDELPWYRGLRVRLFVSRYVKNNHNWWEEV